MNAKTLEVESTFHHYVRPKIHPMLSDFCTELTGIVQDMVDGQPTLEETLDKFDAWLKSEGLYPPPNPETPPKFAFITMGEWDLKGMLPRQNEYFDIPRKPYFGEWINLKKTVFDTTKIWPRGMLHMLDVLGVEHTGRDHS